MDTVKEDMQVAGVRVEDTEKEMETATPEKGQAERRRSEFR